MVVLCIAAAAAGISGCGDSEASTVAQERSDQGDAADRQKPSRPNTVKLNLDGHLPADAVTYTDTKQQVELTFPADWHRAKESLTPRRGGPGGSVAVGSTPLHPGPDKACSRAYDLPQVELGPTAALVHIDIRPGEDPSAAPKWPRRFHLLKQVRPVDPERPGAGQVFPWTCLNRVGVAGLWGYFRADGRVFYVTAVAGKATSKKTRSEVLGVLYSVEFR